MGNELSYEYGYYDGGDFLDRHNWADVSQAALRREKQAEATFATLKKDWESRQDLPAWSKHVIPLLDPSHHLVEKVWVRFRKHVKDSSSSSPTSGGGGHGGHGHWALKRRIANQEERKLFHITRKSKAYFVDAIYTVCGGDGSNNNNINSNQAGGSQATLAVATVGEPAAVSLENKKRTASRHLPGLLLQNTSTSGAIIAADHLSKKPRRLQDLSNTTGNPNKKNPTQKKPVPVVSNSTLPLGVHHHHHHHHHSFKYGDIVGIVNPLSSPRNVIAASHPAAVQYRPPPTLAMVICLVDPHTVRIVYPNQVQAHVPIHQIQLVKPMPIMPLMPVVVVGGGNNSNNNKVAGKTGK